MLDIIIPTYKNKPELIRTLRSINQTLLPLIKVTIIDDCSDLYYNDILEAFPFATIFYNEKNIGPGLTRQRGIELTSEPYLMFIDTGDYFLSQDVLRGVIQYIIQNPNYVIYSWQYKIRDRISEDTNNRMHGRVYSRNFIKKYNVEFCPDESYTNEDVGFNRLCRLLVKNYNLPVAIFNTPILVYSTNENSITKKNNNEFFYNQQNVGLARNGIQIIKKAEENNIKQELILDELNTLMSGLYYCFLCTLYERPEFLQNAWIGARKFLIDCFLKHTENTTENFMRAYSMFVKVIYKRSKYWKHFKNLNVQKFLKDLEKYEEVPSWYKGV